MASCGDCALSKKCNNSYLKGRGSRPAKTEIMVIQEFPTYFDDRVGKALSGDTQKKLTYFFEMAGIDHREVYFTSALKCSPKKSADVKNVHLDECRKYLFHEILTHKPKIIIAMGRWAYQAVTDHTSIREFRGHFDSFSLDYDNEVGGREVTNTFECKVMPTWSLGTSLKKWEYNGDIIRDFKKSQKYVKTGNVPMLPDPKTNLILTRRGLKDFIEKYREVEKATTDFETTGFNFWTDKVINAGYAADGNNADVIYLTPYKKEHMAKHIKKTDKWEALWDKENIEKAKEINAFLKGNKKHCLKALQIVNSFDHLKLILHNGKFDIKFARKYGIDYKNFWFDTLMADPLIDENLGHSLNIAMERRSINYGPYDTTEIWKWTNKDEKKKKSYQHIPPITIVRYLGIDVCGDMRLFNKQVKELKSEGLYDHMMETKMPALHERIDAEWIGVKADRELILKSSRIVQKKQKKLMKKLIEVTGNEEFNPNSPDQINNYMQDNGYPFKKLKVKETNKGYSTAKDELEKFLKYKKYKEFPQLILNCKKLTKIRGTYIDGKDGDGGMLQYLDKKGRIHANYNLWTPRTSRYSCNSPSLQVWPRPIKGLPNTRNFIIPRNKDWMLFEADYSQLEQCVVAALAKDKVLTQRIQDGMDLHCINAADLGHKLKNIPDWVTYEHMLVTNDKESLITDPQLVKELMKDVERHGADINFKEKRTHAKNIGFGLNYGKIAMTFAEEFGISIDEAEEMVDAYFEVYYGMKEWRDNIIEEALTVGHISLLSGRKRRFTEAMRWLNHELCEGVWSARMLREEIGRQAMNYPVQGGAHEVFEPAVIRLNNRFRAEGLKAVIMLSIHDGIVGECPREEKEIVRKCILEEMPHTFHPNTDMAITLKVDVDFYKWEWYGEKIK